MLLALQAVYSLRHRLKLLVVLPMCGFDKAALRSDIRDVAHTTWANWLWARILPRQRLTSFKKGVCKFFSAR